MIIENISKNVNLVINQNDKYYFTGKTTLVKIIMNLQKKNEQIENKFNESKEIVKKYNKIV